VRIGVCVEFQVLGPLEIRDGHRGVHLGSSKQRLLLAALLVHANQVVSLDRLVDIIWGDGPPADAAATLQNHVSRLRATLEPGRAPGSSGSLVLTRPPGYLLHVDEDQVDARRFEQLAAEGRVALRDGDPGTTAATQLSEALALWRGPALAEFADEPFARAEAARLDELRMNAQEDRVDAELASGRHGELIGELEGLARQNPLRERLWARWMLALYRCGRQAEALGACQELRRHLGDELGITPNPELVALEEAILLQKPELDWVPAARGRTGAESGSDDRSTTRNGAGTPREVVPPKTRYATASDGVHIAYQVVGDGPFDLVEVGGFVSHLEFGWEGAEYAHYVRRLAGFARVIRFDKRGTGMSDPVPVHALPSLEQRMDDLRAVMDAVGSERAAVFGESEGGQMAALFAATYPERTRALVMYGTYARLRSAADYPPGQSDDFLEAFARATEASWGEVQERSVWAVDATRDPRFRDWLGRWARNAGSPGSAATLLRMGSEIDIRPVLPAIRVPTLVLHRVDEPLIDVAHARYLAAHIPGAKYVELPGEDHVVFAGDVDRLVDEIEEFLTGTDSRVEPDRVLATLLFIEVSDAGARDLCERPFRGEVARFRGGGVTRRADGLLAAFDGPARAVRCGLAVTDALQRLGVDVRAGVHTGECEVLVDGLGGTAVDIVVGIASRAAAGSVLASRTLTELVAGSRLRFTHRGDHELEGVPGTWPLFTAEAPGPAFGPGQ
jgi:DNA-binding SARP family transcriptional activator/pimeloyl-ACP methyl ester carboxylesterase